MWSFPLKMSAPPAQNQPAPKRSAGLGQWKTPPVPMYMTSGAGAGGVSGLPHQHPSASDLQNLHSLSLNGPVGGGGGGGGGGAPPAAPLPRSLSAPNLLLPQKRAKRLARNRASARLRRLRKKNLVESYEAEVTSLTASLGKLRGHEWGGGT